MVKTLVVLFSSLIPFNTALSQMALSRDEALAQIYKDYAPAKQQAHWVCSDSQKSNDPAKRDGWACSEGEVVSTSLLLMSQIKEGDDWKTYVVTSAVPAQEPHEYECHMCAPSVGVGIFVWHNGRWKLANANVAAGFYGEYGGPPIAGLVAIGPERHGIVLWAGYSGQGYHDSMKYLLAPVGNIVSEIWQLHDEADNSGTVDPTDNLAPHKLYYAEATFKFVYNGKDETYDIIAMSRGRDSKGPANWTAVYRFRNGKYELLRKTLYMERLHTFKSIHRADAKH